ncbi:MAG: tripartite tricarboxylate transporter TctB family protein [Pseudomonadota bacterium]
MKIKNGKDFWAGLMFISFGVAFALGAQNYPMGEALRMGPGYFPTILGGLCAIMGVVVFSRAFISKFENPLKQFTVRLPLLVAAIVIGAVTYYGDSNSWFTDGSMSEFVLSALALMLFFGAFGPKALFLILLAALIFGYAIKPLGLALAIVVLTLISALAGHDFRKKEVAILTVILVLFGVLVFVKGLGLPYKIWPGE